MFQIPAPTRFDLRFTLFGTPVRVHPLFWLMGAIFGLSPNPMDVFIWVVVVFISILVHEFGHSITMRLFGWESYIVLYIFGGLAVPTSPHRGRRVELSQGWLEQVLISLAGPFAGFLLLAVILGIFTAAGGRIVDGILFGFIPIPYPLMPGNPIVVAAVSAFIFINIFWGFINLMPVFPLDGGQATRAIFVRISPMNGLTNSLWLSVLTGALVTLAAIVFLQEYYLAFLFGILAMQSYQVLRYGGGRTF